MRDVRYSGGSPHAQFVVHREEEYDSVPSDESRSRVLKATAFSVEITQTTYYSSGQDD